MLKNEVHTIFHEFYQISFKTKITIKNQGRLFKNSRKFGTCFRNNIAHQMFSQKNEVRIF